MPDMDNSSQRTKAVEAPKPSKMKNEINAFTGKIQAMSINHASTEMPTAKLGIKGPSNERDFNELQDPANKKQLREQIEADHALRQINTRFPDFSAWMDQDMLTEWTELTHMSDENIMSSYNFLCFREARQYKRKARYVAGLQEWRQRINHRRSKDGDPPLLETWKVWMIPKPPPCPGACHVNRFP